MIQVGSTAEAVIADFGEVYGFTLGKIIGLDTLARIPAGRVWEEDMPKWESIIFPNSLYKDYLRLQILPELHEVVTDIRWSFLWKIYNPIDPPLLFVRRINDLVLYSLGSVFPDITRGRAVLEAVDTIGENFAKAHFFTAFWDEIHKASYYSLIPQTAGVRGLTPHDAIQIALQQMGIVKFITDAPGSLLWLEAVHSFSTCFIGIENQQGERISQILEQRVIPSALMSSAYQVLGLNLVP